MANPWQDVVGMVKSKIQNKSVNNRVAFDMASHIIDPTRGQNTHAMHVGVIKQYLNDNNVTKAMDYVRTEANKQWQKQQKTRRY